MNLIMVQFKKDNRKMVKDMEEEFSIGVMDQYMKVIGKKTQQMEEVD